jgi:uncharacterized protein
MEVKVSARRVIFLLLILLSGASAQAQRVNELWPSGYVNDFAHVLTRETIAEIESICHQLDVTAHAQIAVVTVQSLQGSDVETYAVDLFKRWGIGNKSSNRGVLILLAIQDHRYRIEVGYGLESILPDGKVGGFGREVVPYLRTGDYNGAVLLLTNRVADVIAADSHVEITHGREVAPATPETEPQTGLSAGAMGLIVIVIILIVIFTPLRRLLFWWILLGGGGRSGGSWGGGGFGGGGFGGFGGGSSGGGGASGGW